MIKPEFVLVTGAAGFIGYHLTKRLCAEGFAVVGVDNVNDYYDVNLKNDRLNNLRNENAFTFYNANITDRKLIAGIFDNHDIKYVVNLAAQAGVRYSFVNPFAYAESNLTGFANIIESARKHRVKHLVYASSSSVYGANEKLPFSTRDNVDHPLSLYAATKKSNELIAHAYSAMYDLPTTGLRFFSVYGPYGRPDMALFIFTKSILSETPIQVYNHGKMKRDFTYIDDIIECLYRILQKTPQKNPSWDGSQPDPATSFAPYRIYNLGNSKPVELLYYIETLEKKIGKKAIKEFLPIQLGDVPETIADVSDLEKDIGFKPSTAIEEGISKFVDWYLEYYQVGVH